MNEIITSLQNARVKRVVALQQKSAERRRCERFVVEGLREVRQCIDTGHEVAMAYVCPAATQDPAALSDLCAIIPPECQCEVTPEVYDKMAYRGGTEGIVAEVVMQPRSLDDLDLGTAPLIVVVESVEKPGNLGAILRTADAAAATAVIVCDPRADLYNPNLIRSSIGAVFTVPCVQCSTAQCIEFLKAHGVAILTAQLQDSHYYYDTPMTGGTAIVLGTEATGLSQPWRDAATAHILIPMLGRLDSLNVAASAAILLYEAVRQRQGKV